MPEAWTLWTARSDYFATGEGRRIMALIGYAVDEKGCRELFAQRFHSYYAQHCEISAGLVCNRTIEYLFSKELLHDVPLLGARGGTCLSAELFFNFS